jgi:hypothetical protein
MLQPINHINFKRYEQHGVVNTIPRSASNIRFNKKFFPNLTVSSFLWQRGFIDKRLQIPLGLLNVFYAPSLINIQYEGLLFEKVLHDLHRIKTPEVTLHLKTFIIPYPDTIRVSQIHFQVIVSKARISKILFNSYLEIGNKTNTPFVKPHNLEVIPSKEWSRIVK